MEMIDVNEIIKKYKEGLLNKEDIVRAIRGKSASISFASIEKILANKYPLADIESRSTYIEVGKLSPTESCLELGKYELVKLLFERLEDFENMNREFFKGHPVSALRLTGARYAILDGHHRVRRLYELGGHSAVMEVKLLWTRDFDLLQNYENQLEEVRRKIGSCHIKDIKLC